MASVATVYRHGSKTDDALTPRQADLAVSPGRMPGLSVNIAISASGKSQKLDLRLLDGTGLEYFADDPNAGGEAGHGVITPVDGAGGVDMTLLKEWASFRGTGTRHRFTQVVLDTIVVSDIRSES